jgi:serine/threonine protein kinase
MNNITQKNNIAENMNTAINPNLNNVTVRNLPTENFADISAGTILLEKYVVKKRLKVNSGEANVFVCEYGGKEFVAKVYNRPDAIKPEIIEKLQNLDSPNVAKFYDVGTFNGNTVVILPYYKLGSLQDKKISFKSLKQNILPCLNEVLKILHGAGILHKDLKPANIMFLENQKGVALIDFGISSVIDNNAGVVVTKSGLTFAYASPEALRNAYLEESDYYSMGITIYELFCGKLPYPENMPQELQNLISGLTYNDLTNRGDKENPNRRWTYDEVKNWLDGKSQPVPGAKIRRKYFTEIAYG